jgi:acid phosphatase
MLSFRFSSRFAFFFVVALSTAILLGCGSNQAKTAAAAPAASTSGASPAPSTSPAPAAAPAVQLTASPTSITSGQNATLTWTTTGATSVSISPGSLGSAASGSVTVTPTATTTYTATATGAGGTATATATVTVTAAQLGYAFGHVVIVALENKDYSQVVGNTSAMPYLNGLITKYGLATNFYANTHPSIGNYFMLTTGQILTNDDSYSGTVSADNVVRELNAAGKTWRAYAEDLPNAGYTGGDTGNYIERHNPLSYFSDVRNDAAMAAAGLVPFTQFPTDLAAGKLPQYTFIAPNMYNDAHECPNGINGCLATADNWMQQNVAPLIADPNFAKDGVLIIWFDEADTDNANGGGKIPVVFISPAWSKAGYQSPTFGQQENLLRFTMDALGVTTVPGAGATATGWNEFFNAH